MASTTETEAAFVVAANASRTARAAFSRSKSNKNRTALIDAEAAFDVALAAYKAAQAEEEKAERQQAAEVRQAERAAKAAKAARQLSLFA